MLLATWFLPRLPQLSRHVATTATMTWLNRSASPWTILALPSDIKNQNKQAIDKAYRQMLLQVHPDHGGTTETFLRVKQARDTLVVQHSGPDYMLSNDSSGVAQHTENHPIQPKITVQN